MTRETEKNSSSLKTETLFIWFAKSRYLGHKAGIKKKKNKKKKTHFLFRGDRSEVTVVGHCLG